jgi:hypothetical protein
MARTVDLLVGTEDLVSAVTVAIEDALGATLANPAADGEPAHLAVDRTDIYVGPHHFDDGDLHKPDGTPQSLRSQYTHWVEVRDLDRQLATARRLYEAFWATGSWKLVLADDVQKVIDSYDPGT